MNCIVCSEGGDSVSVLCVEYTGLHAAVMEWDFRELEDLQEHRKLLEKIEPSITKHMKPSELLTHMSDTLKTKECEEIRAVRRAHIISHTHMHQHTYVNVCLSQVETQRGPLAASEKMVRCLLRSDQHNWFKVLKIALEQCDLTLALQLLEPSTVSRSVH